MFEECKLEGEFTLSSGRQSGVFYDFDLLMPTETADYVQDLVKQVPDEVRDQIDFVAAPALGGIVPGYLFAFALRKPFVIIDKEGGVRGPEFQAGRYLIVDDVITSFQAANKVVAALDGPECLGVAAYIFRGSYEDLQKQSYPAFYLARKEQEV
jgi:orotate phosphoribosyltransferase